MEPLARLLLATRMWNGWTGMSYSVEQVAELDPVWFVLMEALRIGLHVEGPAHGLRA